MVSEWQIQRNRLFKIPVMQSGLSFKKKVFCKKVGEHMDLPPEFHSFQNYSTTSAHKLNHSFKPNCAWSNIQHPCYGFVPSVITLQDVRQGEELTIHYMMDMEEASEWYLEAWEKFSIKSNQ